jgi:hypothetical protein
LGSTAHRRPSLRTRPYCTASSASPAAAPFEARPMPPYQDHNYYATFISLADDCPATVAEEPPHRAGHLTAARHPWSSARTAAWNACSVDDAPRLHALEVRPVVRVRSAVVGIAAGPLGCARLDSGTPIWCARPSSSPSRTTRGVATLDAARPLVAAAPKRRSRGRTGRDSGVGAMCPPLLRR